MQPDSLRALCVGDHQPHPLGRPRVPRLRASSSPRAQDTLCIALPRLAGARDLFTVLLFDPVQREHLRVEVPRIQGLPTARLDVRAVPDAGLGLAPATQGKEGAGGRDVVWTGPDEGR